MALAFGKTTIVHTVDHCLRAATMNIGNVVNASVRHSKTGSLARSWRTVGGSGTGPSHGASVSAGIGTAEPGRRTSACARPSVDHRPGLDLRPNGSTPVRLGYHDNYSPIPARSLRSEPSYHDCPHLLGLLRSNGLPLVRQIPRGAACPQAATFRVRACFANGQALP